jgi:ParB family transcriptional regulator, chromosome partitioning protein
MPRNALGRGLSALIRDPEPPPQQQQPAPAPVGAVGTVGTTGAATAVAPALSPAEGMFQVDIDLIDPSPFQPRTRFREEALDELARSIRSSGIVQPLVARRMGNRFELIAGERRWRAAQRAGLTRVPVVTRYVPDEKALEMTLVENLQREDLNPIEQAHAFQRLTEEFHFTQEEVADRTGKDRATVANALRLLKLEPPIQDLLEDGRLSASHARALLGINDFQTRLAVCQRIAKGGMTVRQVERYAARTSRETTVVSSPPAVDPNTKAALEDLQREYGTRIQMTPCRLGKPGRLAFEYYDDSDLTRLYDQLMRK